MKVLRINHLPILISVLIIATILLISSSMNPVSAQQQDSVTPSATLLGTSLITVTYIEPINVRTGPSSFDYPVVGTLPVGGTAVAIGRSPAGEWIEILYPDAPRGTAWVYAANVSLSPGALLPVVEPPPTPTPLVTSTINPTFAAAFPNLPTATRLPTFTPPAPLSIPTFQNPVPSSSGRTVTAWAMAGLVMIGVAGLAVSAFRHK